MYKTSTLFKQWTEDAYEEGEVGETKCCTTGLSFEEKTLGKLRDKIFEYFRVKEMDCDGEGNFCIELLEDDFGLPASEKQICEWKKGNIRLWIAIYMFSIYKMEKVMGDLNALIVKENHNDSIPKV